jgi:hypothetical protein
MSRRFIWILNVIHLIAAAAVLAHAAAHLAINPKIERAVLLYFVPPVLAVLLLAVNLIRGTNPAVIILCQVFLDMIAVAVLLGELKFFLPNIKPQFPGVPPQQDRILTFYFIAYMMFLWILLPPYFLGGSMYQHYRKVPAAISLPTCCFGTLTWLATMVLLVALLPRIFAKLF